MSLAELWGVAQEIVVFFVALGTPVIAWLLWSLRREFVKRSDCEVCRKEIAGRISDLEERQGRDAAHRDNLAQKLEVLPTSEDLAGLKVSMTELAGNMKAMQATISGQADLLRVVKEQGDTVHKYLLNKGK